MQDLDNEIINELVKPEVGETAQGYSAFLVWVQLPLKIRATDDALEIVAEKAGLSPATIKNYRSNFKWFERANMIEGYMFKKQLEHRQLLNEQTNEEIAVEMRDIQKDAMKAAKLGVSVANQLLETFPMANKILETDIMTVVKADGTTKQMPMKTYITMSGSLRDVPSLLRESLNAIPKAMGLPTETIKHTVVKTDGKSIETLSDDDIQREITKLQAEINNAELVSDKSQ